MGDLRDFVSDLLETEGAAVDFIEPDGLEVLAPEPLRAAMGWPEFIRLGFGPAPPPGATPIGLEGDWLDRFGALFGERGRFAERQLDLCDALAPPSDPERLLGRALDLANAVWRLHGAKWSWTRCVLLEFRYTAVSDEKREGLVWLGLNEGTGAVLDEEMLQRLRAPLASEAEWRAPEPEARIAAGAGFDAATLAARVEPLALHFARRDLEPFLNAMRRRLDRDCGRIHQYHDNLRRAAQVKLAGLEKAPGEKAESDRKRESLRIAAIEREYAAKLDDLRHNYALRVSLDWTQGLALYCPVYRYELLVKRRKGERIVGVDWHPALRMIEPPPCDMGLGLGRTRFVCDDHLHLSDASGPVACPSCEKAWRRA